MSKVIIIGWDGATWDLLAPWEEVGYLPNVARLRRMGGWGPLRSTLQPLTAVAWSSFLTGCRPGKHGLYDFVARVPGSYDVTLSGRDQRRVPGLWQYLSRDGKAVCAANVPMMVPVTPVNGVLVGGIDAPGLNEQTVYPPHFVEELKHAVPHYRIAASERTLADWEQSLHEMITGRGDLLFHLLHHHSWDALMVVFSATDIVQHIFWGHMARQNAPYANTILDIYRQCDALLGRVLDEMDQDTTLILMSDHGAGPLRGALHLNTYLEQGGFLKRLEGGEWRLRALRLGKRLLPAGARAWLRRRVGGVRDRLESQLVNNAYDWSQTQVIALGSYGNLFFNLRGREPQGIVPPDQKNQLTNKLTDHLMQLHDPTTGRALVKKVWPGEELYGGGANFAPDVVVEWTEDGLAYEVRTRFGNGGDRVFSATMPLNDLAPETLLTATHRMDGVLAAVGPSVTPGPIRDAHILDLAPTILHTLGLPVPRCMDGRVLAELTAGLGPAQYADDETPDDHHPAGLNDDDAAAVAERLRHLGYLG